jgi:hypothetical protein
MQEKSEKRTQFDYLKTAYHVVDTIRQITEIRRGWDRFKRDAFEFFIVATCAGVALLAGWLL